MPRRRSENESKSGSSDFILVVDSWDFEYSFRVSVEPPLDLCGEQRDVIISGTLKSKTSWGCKRAALTLRSDGVEPQHWRPEWSAFGSVRGVKRGVLRAYVRLPPPSVQSFMTALSAGKVRGLYVRVDDFARRAGKITHFFTTDPDEEDE